MSDVQTSDTADSRRRAIVRAGFDQIAAAGFEGLRMREVAARAGVNIATVHYYVNSKESLIREVALYTAERLREAQPETDVEGDGPEAELRAQLRGVARNLEADSALLQVLGEVRLRAHRDPDVAAILDELSNEWYAALEKLVTALPSASRDRTQPADAAALMTMTLLGACLPPVDIERVAAAMRQMEAWLLGS